LFTQPPTVAKILWATSPSPPFTHVMGKTNGTINMRVLTALTAPVASSTIKVLVSVKAADNLEFACPQSLNADGNTWSYLPPQSGYLDDSDHPQETEADLVVAGTVSPVVKERYLVNHGEQILSMRQVLRRMSLSRVAVVPSTPNVMTLWKQTMTRFPLSPGYETTNGYDSAKGVIVTTSNFNYNYSFMTPYNWLVPAYVALRGSTRWTFNLDSTVAVGQFRIFRIPGLTITPAVSTSTTAYTDSSTASAWYTINSFSGAAGQSITNQYTQAGISVELPMYSPYRFVTTNPVAASNPTSYADSQDCHRLEVSTNSTTNATSGLMRMWQYNGIGTDFNVHFFLNVPTLYVYSSVPTPN